MILEHYFYLTAILSAFVAASFLLLTKWRVVNYLQRHGKFGINNAASCVFCLCFWLGMVGCLVLVLFMGYPWQVFTIPLPAAALARYIIN